MDNSLIDFFLNENVSISTGNFVQHLLVTLVLSLLVKIVYTRFSTTISNKKEFSKNFVILGLTTCIVITIVKSSLALSLGLVVALSIVRFRAAIKEPEELAYLFLIIAIVSLIASFILLRMNYLLQKKKATVAEFENEIAQKSLITKKWNCLTNQISLSKEISI